MCSLRSDRRFGYAVANPAGQSRGVPVLVHDAERRFLDGIHAFASFAQFHRLAILAPMFPPNVLGDDDENGCKFLLKPGLRYDHLLLDMVRAVENRQGFEGTSPLLIHGYSGGAQFAHRFALLHPLQVFAVSVAAPEK
jgi:hypothetical protein